MGLAGLWSCWKSPDGDLVHSFTILTINADAHPLMRLYHRPVDEKRMVVVLPEEHYGDWLNAPPELSMGFMCAYPADRLCAEPAPAARPAKAAAAPELW